MNKLKDFFNLIRLPFLILTPACVFLGVAAARWTSGEINVPHALLILVGSLAAHISVNALNEYFDFKSGLDAKTVRTPFSGGSGTLPQKPGLARQALWIGLVALAVTAATGAYFLYLWNLTFLPLGILGLFIIVAYTPWLSRHPALCLLAPGLGFGVLMVMGTYFALTGTYTWTALIASLIPFFLVSNLLLINQFPDVEADRSVGRRHLPIVAGRQTSSRVYAAFLCGAYLSIIMGVLLGLFPAASLLGLATMVLAIPAVIGAFRYAQEPGNLIPYLGMNVLIVLATPVLTGIGFLIG